MKSYHFIICLLIAGLLASCQSNQQPTTVSHPTSIPVFALKKGTLNTTMSMPGVLQPYQTVDLYAKENGFIKTMTVDVGSQVHKGQLLMTLDAPEMTAALTQSQEDLHTKEAIYRGSKANYDRLLKTSKTPGTISPNDLDMAHAKMSADSSALLASKSAYQQSADLKNYLEVRAPFDGVISSRNVYPGAYVTPSDKSSNKSMLTLQEQSKLRLVVDVPEAAINYFSNKDTIHFSVKTIPGKQFAAVVNRMAGSLSNEMRSEQMQMDIPNKTKELLPGMFAQVTLQLTNAQKTFIVPQSAVTQNSQRIFVIRVLNHKAQWVGVKKGRETTDSLEVYGDLKNGDFLINNATDEIKSGAMVNTSEK
ncbi:efflux RND transporter periplasmic adaptor subunit [Mucilaginibacter sp.]|uniref:efflux RND transporter periplasmic adaptor subunit n=1 Tax=Mucilaginibacter sp. TaxID=1882438 RepID=UPI00261C6781|nr:efflux RND transporter periplasmic adaptor subunit [Mucilaginibacter sp.]MDB4923527.1 transporter [Mucilaginibacter sp.]